MMHLISSVERKGRFSSRISELDSLKFYRMFCVHWFVQSFIFVIIKL